MDALSACLIGLGEEHASCRPGLIIARQISTHRSTHAKLSQLAKGHASNGLLPVETTSALSVDSALYGALCGSTMCRGIVTSHRAEDCSCKGHCAKQPFRQRACCLRSPLRQQTLGVLIMRLVVC